MRWPYARRSLLDEAVTRVTELRAERDKLRARLSEPPPPEEAPLTPEEVAELHRVFRERLCKHCLGAHARACPRVRELRFHPDAKLAVVRFWRDGEWSQDGIMWPEDLPLEPGAGEAA